MNRSLDYHGRETRRAPMAHQQGDQRENQRWDQLGNQAGYPARHLGKNPAARSAGSAAGNLPGITRLTPALAALFIALLVLTPAVRATGGLPIVEEFQGQWSYDRFLAAGTNAQEAYVAGVLDALALVVAQGEAFTAEGIDPRNVYAIVYEAIAGTPANGAVHLLVHALAQEAPMHPPAETLNSQPAALVVWRALALHHCCWEEAASGPRVLTRSP